MKFLPILLLSSLLFSCKKDAPHGAPINDNVITCADSIYCAGNSLTADLGPDYTAYPEYLAQMLGRDPGTVINGGNSGWISTWIADEYLNRKVVLKGAVIIEAGSNNNWSSETIKADILRMIGDNKKFFVLDIATGNLPDRWPNHPWGYYDHNEELNDQIEEMVGTKHFIRIKDYLQLHMDGSKQDSIDVFVNDCEPTSLHSDFIHKNSLGNYWMAAAIAERLVPCNSTSAQ